MSWDQILQNVMSKMSIKKYTSSELIGLDAPDVEESKENTNINMINLILSNHGDINSQNIKGDTSLHILIKLEYYSLAKHVIEENQVNLNIKNKQGLTPLCYTNDFEMIKYLIEKGANVNIGSNDKSPLMNALNRDNLNVLKYLLDHGGDVNSKDGNNCSLLMIAISRRNHKIVKFLINRNADHKLKNNKGENAIDYVILLDEYIDMNQD